MKEIQNGVACTLKGRSGATFACVMRPAPNGDSQDDKFYAADGTFSITRELIEATGIYTIQ